jgi:hypothetical protein
MRRLPRLNATIKNLIFIVATSGQQGQKADGAEYMWLLQGSGYRFNLTKIGGNVQLKKSMLGIEPWVFESRVLKLARAAGQEPARLTLFE